MVIQKLVECYHTLQAGGHDVAPLGWNRQPISYQLDIGYDGTINGLLDVRESYTDRNGRNKNDLRIIYYLVTNRQEAVTTIPTFYGTMEAMYLQAKQDVPNEENITSTCTEKF